MIEYLKGISIQDFGRNFDHLIDKFCLKQSLRTLRKFSVAVWKSNAHRDFERWFEAHNKCHPKCLEIKVAGDKAVDCPC